MRPEVESPGPLGERTARTAGQHHNSHAHWGPSPALGPVQPFTCFCPLTIWEHGACITAPDPWLCGATECPSDSWEHSQGRGCSFVAPPHLAAPKPQPQAGGLQDQPSTQTDPESHHPATGESQ